MTLLDFVWAYFIIRLYCLYKFNRLKIKLTRYHNFSSYLSVYKCALFLIFKNIKNRTCSSYFWQEVYRLIHDLFHIGLGIFTPPPSISARDTVDSYRHGMCFRMSWRVFVSSILFSFPQRTHYFWRVFRFLFMERKQDYN